MTEWYDHDPYQGVSEDTRRREAEYDRLIREEAELDLSSIVAHQEQVFESISALCTLWRNGVMNGDDALKFIQNIVG